MKIENLCICYGSEYHLGIIILEYLKRNSLKSKNINSYFEEGIQDQVNLLRNKYKMKQISNINFKKKDLDKIEKIKDGAVIFVRGTNEYMEKVKKLIEEKVKNKKGNIQIISCYDFNEQFKVVGELMKKNQKFIYTHN